MSLDCLEAFKHSSFGRSVKIIVSFEEISKMPDLHAMLGVAREERKNL